MGADIHSYVEIKQVDDSWALVTEPVFDNRWGDSMPQIGAWTSEPFTWRNYRVFGFLAGVRDHEVPTIADGRGIPADSSGPQYPFEDDYHSQTWVLASELLEYNYDTGFGYPDRRLPLHGPDGYGDAPMYPIITTTVGEYLGDWFLDRVAMIAGLHEDPRRVRVVMAFDS